MKTRHSASGPFPLRILVALATIIAMTTPANLAALGSREPPVPANEGSIRQAVAPPYNAPAE
ncbi:MAG: hypothetical protein RBT68_07815, partial [Spirochaetia bacterium]|nr:hypothetical protein [Spirochaetia bacterium]